MRSSQEGGGDRLPPDVSTVTHLASAVSPLSPLPFSSAPSLVPLVHSPLRTRGSTRRHDQREGAHPTVRPEPAEQPAPDPSAARSSSHPFPPSPSSTLLVKPRLVPGLPRMLSPLSPQPSLPSPTFTPQASPSPSSAARVRTSSRRKGLAVSVSLARAFLGAGIGPSTTLEEGGPVSDFSSGGHSRSGTDYGEGSGHGSGASSRSRNPKRRHLELSEGDLLHIGHPLPGTTSQAPLQVVKSPPLPATSAVSPPAPAEPSFTRLEIVRQLGTGSYAVVYLVREVLDQPTGRKRSDSGSDDLEWDMEGEDGIVGLGTGAGRGRRYGREFGESAPLHAARFGGCRPADLPSLGLVRFRSSSSSAQVSEQAGPLRG